MHDCRGTAGFNSPSALTQRSASRCQVKRCLFEEHPPGFLRSRESSGGACHPHTGEHEERSFYFDPNMVYCCCVMFPSVKL